MKISTCICIPRAFSYGDLSEPFVEISLRTNCKSTESSSRAFSCAYAVAIAVWMFYQDIADSRNHWSRCAITNVDSRKSLEWNVEDIDCTRIAEFCGVISYGCWDWWLVQMICHKLLRCKRRDALRTQMYVSEYCFTFAISSEHETHTKKTTAIDLPPVCNLRWLFKFVICVKAFPQSMQA